MILSTLIAIYMCSADVSLAWIIGEILVLNLIGIYVLAAFRIANQWAMAIVLRLGRFAGLKGSGAFWIIPIADTIPMWIDHRVVVFYRNCSSRWSPPTRRNLAKACRSIWRMRSRDSPSFLPISDSVSVCTPPSP
jgi:hypothetical protein